MHEPLPFNRRVSMSFVPVQIKSVVPRLVRNVGVSTTRVITSYALLGLTAVLFAFCAGIATALAYGTRLNVNSGTMTVVAVICVGFAIQVITGICFFAVCTKKNVLR